MDHSNLCKGCWAQMRLPILLGGPLSLPYRLVGFKRSGMNPNLCNLCETMFERVCRSKQISRDTTILFADVRGYTALTDRVGAMRIGAIVRAFQAECGQAIWRQDGIVNKTMGDGLMAIFNFPIPSSNHAQRALMAALDIQRSCRERLGKLEQDVGLGQAEVGVGIGIDSGEVAIGEFSAPGRDYTAIGSVVNLAARLESTAQAGEILVSAAARDRIGAALDGAERRQVAVKGLDRAVSAYAITPN